MLSLLSQYQKLGSKGIAGCFFKEPGEIALENKPAVCINTANGFCIRAAAHLQADVVGRLPKG